MKDIGAAFKFQFQDPNWVSKMFLGALFELLSILIIGSWIVMGYQVEVIQRVMRKDPTPLPEWDRLSEKLLRGVKLFLISIVYYLPLLLIFIPFVFLIGLSSTLHSHEVEAFSGLTLFSIVIFVVLPYVLFVNILLPIVYLEFARNERVGDALNLAAVLRFFTNNWQNAIILALIMLGVNILSAVGIVFCIIGVFFTSFYAKLVSAHLTGQLHLAEIESHGNPA
jgi:hypothetical protein